MTTLNTRKSIASHVTAVTIGHPSCILMLSPPVSVMWSWHFNVTWLFTWLSISMWSDPLNFDLTCHVATTGPATVSTSRGYQRRRAGNHHSAGPEQAAEAPRSQQGRHRQNEAAQTHTQEQRICSQVRCLQPWMLFDDINLITNAQT